MQAVISFRHHGAVEKENEKLLRAVGAALKSIGVEPWSTLLSFQPADGESRPTPRQMMTLATAEIDRSDFLLVLQCSDERSEGMLIEVGYCLAKGVPVVVATNSSVKNTYLPSFGVASFQWDSLEELAQAITKLDLQELRRTNETAA